MKKTPVSVLLVDDDISNRVFLSEIFTDEVEKVYTACDGEEGLRLYHKHNPDIIVSDIQMPKMNGLDMIERIKLLNTNTRFILISAYDITDFFIRAINIGVDNFIMKPIDLDKMQETLQKVAKSIVTERELNKKTKQLEESEHKFRRIAEDLPNSWLGIFDNDLKLTFLSGHSLDANIELAEKIKGKNIHQVFEILGLNNTIKRELSTHEVKNYEIKIQNSTFLLNTSILIDTDNKANKQIIFVAQDISERKNAENIIRMNEARLSSLLKISQLKTADTQELLEFALDEAISLTDSEIGYIFNYSTQKQELALSVWSKSALEECGILFPQEIYLLENTGLWGEPVRQGKPVIINNYNEIQNTKKSFPETYLNISSLLSIPVFNNDQIVAVVGVANKASNYIPADVRQLTLLMSFVWKILEQQRTEIALKDSERKLMNAVIQAEEKERMRFAQDLHDGLGPILSTTKLYIQTLADTNKPELKSEIVEKARKTIDEALGGLTEISNNLSPHILHNFGLTSATKSFIEKVKSGININFKFNHNLSKRPQEIVEITLYRIIVELINNTIKHSEATGVGIILHEEEDDIKLTYIDDGKGFDVEKASSSISKGMGLFNIKNRVQNLNGKVKFESSQGKGIWVELYIPTK